MAELQTLQKLVSFQTKLKTLLESYSSIKLGAGQGSTPPKEKLQEFEIAQSAVVNDYIELLADYEHSKINLERFAKGF